MLHRMSAAELAGWKAFCQVEMVGEDRQDLRAGIVAAAIFNANRSAKSKVHSPLDHMPFKKREHDDAHRAMSADDQVKAVFGALMTRDAGVKRVKFENE